MDPEVPYLNILPSVKVNTSNIYESNLATKFDTQ